MLGNFDEFDLVKIKPAFDLKLELDLRNLKIKKHEFLGTNYILSLNNSIYNNDIKFLYDNLILNNLNANLFFNNSNNIETLKDYELKLSDERYIKDFMQVFKLKNNENYFLNQYRQLFLNNFDFFNHKSISYGEHNIYYNEYHPIFLLHSRSLGYQNLIYN